MSYMKAVCCWVKSNIEYSLSVIDKFLNFFFICYLCNQSSCNQFVIYCHKILLNKIKNPVLIKGRDITSWYHLFSQSRCSASNERQTTPLRITAAAPSQPTKNKSYLFHHIQQFLKSTHA